MSDEMLLSAERQTELDLRAERALDALAKRDAMHRAAEKAQKECSAAWSELVSYADSVVPVTRSSRGIVSAAMDRARARVEALRAQVLTEGPAVSVDDAIKAVVAGRQPR